MIILQALDLRREEAAAAASSRRRRCSSPGVRLRAFLGQLIIGHFYIIIIIIAIAIAVAVSRGRVSYLLSRAQQAASGRTRILFARRRLAWNGNLFSSIL